jgi:pyrimidine deaminase RibD-like protein
LLLISEGRHEQFGGPHAEVARSMRRETRAGATLYVTLEPVRDSR